MFRIVVFAASAIAFAACEPAKTPEQAAAENAAKAMQEMAAAFGGMAGDATGTAEMDPEKMAAALAQAGAMASAMNPDMSAEDRAKLQAITGAMASGNVHPAASAWIAGANKSLEILKTVKDAPSATAAKAKLAPIYAEMAGPTATLNAMTQDQREIAMGSALPQFMAFGMSATQVMMPLSSNPELTELVSEMLEAMPTPE